MNGSDAKYTSEYVELKTSLEHIRTKIVDIEMVVRDIHSSLTDLREQINLNRMEIAGVKATAAIVGGLTGSLIAVFARLFFTT
ncbi:MAG: hypothetical protein C4527_21345 [Candidatus Omnitrophota bacterium]|jgi:predicted  nucleic acid-binding Zn-ribbon protein|nr:MAG: hypothetical protein C4527_21345 [Candidatus Omnitrophota bacterium]